MSFSTSYFLLPCLLLWPERGTLQNMQSSNRNLRSARLRRQAAAGLLASAALFGIYRVYRWAEPSPSSIAAVLSPTPASSVSLEMEEASFENFADGKKNWSLWAKRIAIERQNGGVSNSLQAATIDDIRDGKLFASPLGEKEKRRRGEEETEHRTPNNEHRASSTSVPLNPQPSTLNQSGGDSDPGLPTATFTAQHGRYMVGSVEGLPAEMQFTYAVQWQFQLTGDVKIRTREGHFFHAPAIQVLELYNRKTGKSERQILCSQGGDITAKGATVHANQARYDDKNQMVECLGGVRAQLKQDSVQAETFHWSLKEEVIRCPEQATGTWQGTPFTAKNLSIDLKHHLYRGTEMDLQVSQEQIEKGHLP